MRESECIHAEDKVERAIEISWLGAFVGGQIADQRFVPGNNVSDHGVQSPAQAPFCFVTRSFDHPRRKIRSDCVLHAQPHGMEQLDKFQQIHPSATTVFKNANSMAHRPFRENRLDDLSVDGLVHILQRMVHARGGSSGEVTIDNLWA